MIKDSWFTVQKIDELTYAISECGHWEKVHSFLVLGEYRAALIDTGLGIGRIKRVTDQLTSLAVEVITTHVHWDHIGGHGEYNSIYVHAKDKDWLVNGINGLSIEQVRRDIARDIVLPTPEEFDPHAYKPFQGVPTGLLQDGDVIDLGNRKLVIIHTPGHSPGHICILDELQGYLFTGDLLYDQAPVYAFYPSTNPEDLVDSWERISAIPRVTRVFGSHNTLGLDPAILDDVRIAVKTLRAQDLVRFGTGVNEFKGFSVRL